jgi:hypothetical protein
MAELMTEDEFKTSLIDRYPNHFEHFYSLYRFADEACRNYHGYNPDAYHASLSLIFGKAFKSYDSIRRLIEVASCEDAGVVLRSLLNLLAVTRWISLDPQKRASKYLASYWLTMKLHAQQSPSNFPPAWVDDIERHFDRIKHLFEYTDSSGKTRLARQWYQPEANTIRDLFVHTDLEKQYDEGYRILSGIEHSDATAYFGMIAGSDKGGGERQLNIHSDLSVPSYLRNGFQYFAEIFSICNRTNPLADATMLQQILEDGKKFYAADMLAGGLVPY